jgi:hypothetical protein
MTKQYLSVPDTEEGATEGATSTTDGLTNTNTLVETMPSLFNPAAAYCYYLNLHGQTDWYLPSKDELDVLHTNRTAIGGFDSGWYNIRGEYWSSSEIGSTGAWVQFADGAQNADHYFSNDGAQNADGNNPGNTYRVRCVRRLK